MTSWTLEVSEGGSTRRQPLAAGLTRIGGPGCEVVLARSDADQLHLWDAPAKLLFIGKGQRPLVNGKAVEESALTAGDRIEWGAAVLTLSDIPPEPVLREIPLEAAVPGPDVAGADARAWARVRAGLLAELGLVERGASRLWQEAVLRGEFDADACARDLSLAAQARPGDPRLLERTGRLLRDLLMAPYQRGLKGAGRRVRGATRTGLAFLLAQVVVLLVFALLFAVVLLVVRLRWGWSVDGFLDSLLELVPS